MAAFEKLDILKRQPRKNSSNGWFGSYDANIVGGLLIGVGMASTGACPGTVLVQLVTGVNSGIFVALGGLLGGILYSRFGMYLKRSPSTSAHPVDTRQHTVQTKFNLKSDHVLLAYEGMCLIIIIAASVFGLNGSSPWLHPVLGGALIGSAQAASLLLTGNPVGVSRAYGEAGEYFWHFLTSKPARGPRSSVTAMTFALGIMAGSFALTQYIATPTKNAEFSRLGAVAGGCTMIFGARLAGGCTSGHGISGMSSFSISSIITVAAMFSGGMQLL